MICLQALVFSIVILVLGGCKWDPYWRDQREGTASSRYLDLFEWYLAPYCCIVCAGVIKQPLCNSRTEGVAWKVCVFSSFFGGFPTSQKNPENFGFPNQKTLIRTVSGDVKAVSRDVQVLPFETYGWMEEIRFPTTWDV